MEGIGNLPVVLDLRNKYLPTFISLQETWLRSYKNVQFAELLRSHRWIFKNADSQLNEEDMISMRNLSFHGVALGIEEELFEKVEEINVQHRNIIAVNVSCGSLKYLIVNVYLPTRGKDPEFIEAVDAIKSVIEQNATDNQRIILMGDLNISITSSARRREAWSSLITDFDLKDNVTGINTHFHHATGSVAELDRFVTRDVDIDIKHLTNELGTSDHIPILAQVSVVLRGEEEQLRGDPIETKINLEKLKDNVEFFAEITDRLADEMETWRHEHTLDTQNGIVSNMIFQAAILTTEQEKFQSQVKKKRKKYKVNKELRRGLQTAKKNYKAKKKKTKKSPEYRRVKHFKRLIREDIRRQTDQEEWRLNSEIIKATAERSSKIFSLLKKIKQETLSENKLPGWIEGYGLRFEAPKVLEGLRELFRQQTTVDYVERFDEERFDAAKSMVRAMRGTDWTEDEYEKIEMKAEEFQKIVDGLKTGKAQDFMGMSNDLLKNVGPRMRDLIYRMTCESLETRDIGGVVRNYGKGTIIIKKPGKPTTSIKNWRKIVCNNTILNVLQIHVQDSIEKKARQEQTKYQLGFTKGIPVSNAVIMREELQQISKSIKKTFFLGVLDLQSCFPRICREEMLVITSRFLKKSEWDILSQLYDETWGELRVESQKSRPFRGDSGSVEGGILSVQILKFYISVLLKMLEDAGFKSGVDFRLRRLGAGQVGAADDLLLYCWSQRRLKLMLKICQSWSDNFRATFSPDKSVIVIQRAPGDHQVYGDFCLNGKELKIVKSAEHLGIPIEESGDNSETLVMERMAKARRAIHGYLSLFDIKSFIPAAVKLEVWKTQFKFVLIYGLDTTNLKAGQLKRIEQFQSKVLRSIFKLSKRASSVKLRLLTGTTSMAYEIWKNRFGALNNVLIKDTMVREVCLLAYYSEVKNSWTYQTMRKLCDLLNREGLSDKLSPTTLIRQERNTYKENMKNILMGVELRRLEADLSDGDIYRLPPEPMKNNLPLTNTPFTYSLQRDMRYYAAIYTGDYYKNYRGPCKICVKSGRLKEDDQEKDDTRHLLSGRCVTDEAPAVKLALANVLTLLRELRPDSEISSNECSEEVMTRFLLNPACPSLQENSLTPEELQLSGLDIYIRRLFKEKHKRRYALLRSLGIVVKRK